MYLLQSKRITKVPISSCNCHHTKETLRLLQKHNHSHFPSKQNQPTVYLIEARGHDDRLMWRSGSSELASPQTIFMAFFASFQPFAKLYDYTLFFFFATSTKKKKAHFCTHKNSYFFYIISALKLRQPLLFRFLENSSLVAETLISFFDVMNPWPAKLIFQYLLTKSSPCKRLDRMSTFTQLLCFCNLDAVLPTLWKIQIVFENKWVISLNLATLI